MNKPLTEQEMASLWDEHQPWSWVSWASMGEPEREAVRRLLQAAAALRPSTGKVVEVPDGAVALESSADIRRSRPGALCHNFIHSRGEHSLRPSKNEATEDWWDRQTEQDSTDLLLGSGIPRAEWPDASQRYRGQSLLDAATIDKLYARTKEEMTVPDGSVTLRSQGEVVRNGDRVSLRGSNGESVNFRALESLVGTKVSVRMVVTPLPDVDLSELTDEEREAAEAAVKAVRK